MEARSSQGHGENAKLHYEELVLDCSGVEKLDTVVLYHAVDFYIVKLAFMLIQLIDNHMELAPPREIYPRPTFEETFSLEQFSWTSVYVFSNPIS